MSNKHANETASGRGQKLISYWWKMMNSLNIHSEKVHMHFGRPKEGCKGETSPLEKEKNDKEKY